MTITQVQDAARQSGVTVRIRSWSIEQFPVKVAGPMRFVPMIHVVDNRDGFIRTIDGKAAVSRRSAMRWIEEARFRLGEG